MPQIVIPNATVSSVATHNIDISRPFLAGSSVMAEVILGTGTGTVSVQFKGTNDGTNYADIGSAITSTNRAVALSTGGINFKSYRAEVVISTNTKQTTVNFYFA